MVVSTRMISGIRIDNDDNIGVIYQNGSQLTAKGIARRHRYPNAPIKSHFSRERVHAVIVCHLISWVRKVMVWAQAYARLMPMLKAMESHNRKAGIAVIAWGSSNEGSDMSVYDFDIAK